MTSVDTSYDYDVVIIGGSFVGLSMAYGLAQLGLNTALIERRALDFSGLDVGLRDQRGIALSCTSVNILQSIGCWSRLSGVATAISQVHVSQRGSFGRTCLRAHELGYDSFGQVVPAYRLLSHLLAAVKTTSVKLIAPADVKQLITTLSYVKLVTDQHPTGFKARLLIAADGQLSFARQQLNIDVEQHDYQQTAIVANLGIELAHHGRAFERFIQDGVLAMLPLSGSRCVSVLTCDQQYAERLLALDEQAYIDYLQRQFGYRLGRLHELGRRSHYPLSHMRAQSSIAERTVIMGNAAQVVSPIAAQGFNLGLRDVAALLDLLGRTPREAIGTTVMLQAYQAARQKDVKRTQQFTHGLAQLFAYDAPCLRLLRSRGLCLLDLLPGVKRRVVEQIMAHAANPNRLCVGLPLVASDD